MAHQFPKQLFRDHLELKAMQLKEEAATLPSDRKCEALLRKARQMNTASQIVDKWLSSPGLRVPR